MKLKLLSLILIALPALAQPSLKAHTIGQCLASNTALTFGSACGGSSVVGSSIDTTGSSLLVVETMIFAFVSGGGVSDSKSNSWTCQAITTSGNFSVQLCYAFPSSASQIGTGHTFTIAAAGTGSFVSGGVMAFVGTQAATLFRTGTFSGGQANANLSVTPVAANDVLVSGFSDDTTNTMTINGGFTIVDTARLTSNGETGATAWEAAPNTSAISFTWSGNTAGVQNVAAFEVGAAPGSGATPTGIKSKKLEQLSAWVWPSYCAGITVPDCNGFSDNPSFVAFACLFADKSCAASVVLTTTGQANPVNAAASSGNDTCLFGANLGALPVTSSQFGSIDTASFAYSCTP